MDRDRTKRIYDLHSWSGILCGLFVYFVSFTGVVALFGDEIKSWENPDYRFEVPATQVPLQPLIDELTSEASKRGTFEDFNFRLPTAGEPAIQGRLFGRTAEGGERFELQRIWHPETGEVIPDRGLGLSFWLIDIHRKLMLPNTIGRTLVGIAGVMLMLSIITGILIHKKILKELFTWRLDRSIRLRWQDSHKAIGVWGLPFHFMIALTGAFLGLVVVMVPITGFLAFKGDTAAIVEAVRGPHLDATGVDAPMSSLDVARRSAEDLAGGPAAIVLVSHWGDETARYTFLFAESDKLIRYSQVVVDGVSGTVVAKRLTEREGLASRVSAAITPLHYATFGGLWVKLLYALLGIGLCIVIATGMMLWLERRLHGYAGHSQGQQGYVVLSRFVVGGTSGLALATVAVFYADKLMTVTPDTRLFWTGTVYFAAWVVTVFYALIRSNSYAANRELLMATAVGLLALPALNNAIMSAAGTFAPGNWHSIGVDVAGVVIGLVTLVSSFMLPVRRSQMRRAKESLNMSVSSV